MLEAVVRRAGEDKVGASELLQISQPLERLRVHVLQDRLGFRSGLELSWRSCWRAASISHTAFGLATGALPRVEVQYLIEPDVAVDVIVDPLVRVVDRTL
jgi:hypothetical protein